LAHWLNIFCNDGDVNWHNCCSRHAVAYLRFHLPQLIDVGNWPPNSLDLNPVDFSVCGALQRKWYPSKIRDDHLKCVLLDCWDQIREDTINGAIDHLLKILTVVIRAHNGRTECHLN